MSTPNWQTVYAEIIPFNYVMAMKSGQLAVRDLLVAEAWNRYWSSDPKAEHLCTQGGAIRTDITVVNLQCDLNPLNTYALEVRCRVDPEIYCWLAPQGKNFERMMEANRAEAAAQL